MSKPILEARYRSKLEQRIADQLEREGIPFEYEARKIPYLVPARQAKYLPDFFCPSNILLEGKGWFKTAAERQKLIHIRNANSGIDVRLVFQDANKPIYKGSPTTYADWATSHEFLWADWGIVPDEWIEEMKRNGKKGK